MITQINIFQISKQKGESLQHEQRNQPAHLLQPTEYPSRQRVENKPKRKKTIKKEERKKKGERDMSTTGITAVQNR